MFNLCYLCKQTVWQKISFFLYNFDTPWFYLNLLIKFTLPEMQALYETIPGEKLDQRNFTKKLVSLNLIRKLNEKKHIGGHRSPALYKFYKRAYNNALKQGVELAF